MFSFKNIYRAYKDCVKHKRNTLNALNFEANLVENICNLEDELKNKTYRIGKSICFLASSPKLREIFAADFRDRVVHHILVNELEEFYEKKFIHDVYNNRKGKGIHGALKRAKSFMNSVGSDGYYLQLDIKGFFYNFDKNILFKYIHSQVKLGNESKIRHSELDSESILYLTNKIIYHDPTKNYTFKGDRKKLENLPEHKTLFKLPKNQGLPIGNLTSQFFANVYLNKFDHFVKRVVNNYKYKKAKYLYRYENLKGKMSLEEIKQFLSVQASFIGHCSHANSYNLVQKTGVIDENNPFDYDRA